MTRRTALAAGAAVAGSVALAGGGRAEEKKKRAVIWFDGPGPAEVYPKGMGAAVAEALAPLEGWEIVAASFDQPEQGLPRELLEKTDVLMWWSKWHNEAVKDELAERIVGRVKEGGMGFIAVHSGFAGKPFIKLMGTSCKWKAGAIDDSSVKVIVKEPSHPIAKGIKDFVIAKSERYTEPFDVPTPESVVFDGVFTRPDGRTEPSRQGMTWQVGKGRVFYFSPGHETYPNFHQPEVQRILRNAVGWAGGE